MQIDDYFLRYRLRLFLLLRARADRGDHEKVNANAILRIVVAPFVSLFRPAL